MKYLLLINFVLMQSCALYKSFTTKPQFKITTSENGVGIYSLKGDLIGETPANLSYKDIEGYIDGDYVTLVLDKPGYHNRILYFDTLKSLEIKIDLKQDKNFNLSKQSLLEEKINILKKHNKLLEDTITDLRNESKLKLTQSKNNPNDMQLDAIQEAQSVLLTQSKIIEEKLAGKSNVRSPASIQVAKISKKLKTKKKRRYQNINKKLMGTYLDIQNLIHLGSLEIAKQKLLEVDAKYPNQATTSNLLAYIEIESGQYEVAHNILNRLVKLKEADQLTSQLLDLIKIVKVDN